MLWNIIRLSGRWDTDSATNWELGAQTFLIKKFNFVPLDLHETFWHLKYSLWLCNCYNSKSYNPNKYVSKFSELYSIHSYNFEHSSDLNKCPWFSLTKFYLLTSPTQRYTCTHQSSLSGHCRQHTEREKAEFECKIKMFPLTEIIFLGKYVAASSMLMMFLWFSLVCVEFSD